MERLFKAGVKVGALLQEWDRLSGEEAAFELLITKHDKLEESDVVDTCLDGLRNIIKHKKVLAEIMQTAFGRDITDLRVFSYQLRVAAEQHETILLDLVRARRTIEILSAAGAFGEEDDESRDDLVATQEVLLAQEKMSLEYIAELVETPSTT